MKYVYIRDGILFLNKKMLCKYSNNIVIKCDSTTLFSGGIDDFEEINIKNYKGKIIKIYIIKDGSMLFVEKVIESTQMIELDAEKIELLINNFFDDVGEYIYEK